MNYIITKAFTGSEWDCVDFLLIPANSDFIKRLKELISFSGSGKHSGEEFWGKIPYSFILEIS